MATSGKISTLEGKVPRTQQALQVTSVERSDLFQPGNFERWNLDELAKRKGGLGIYAKMMLDEQVKAAVDFKRASIIGRGYTFCFGDVDLDPEEQELRIKVMEQGLERMRGSFMDSLRGILRGIYFGYTLTEIVTQNITVEGSTYVGVGALLPRDTASFKFYTDEFGQLIKLTQLVNGRETELDYARFLHYVHAPEEDMYYGASELKAAYRPWFLKDTETKFWAQYLERMAGGFLAIKLGSSGILPGQPEYANLQAVLTNMRSAMGVILPNGVEAELITPPATDAFEKAIQHHDLAISRSLLMPNLLGLSHAGQTGSYSQSQTQIEVYFMTVAADSARLEQCLNDQLFRPIAEQNWDDGIFPQFRFKSASQDHTKWIIDTWKLMCDAGAVITTEEDEAHLRKLLEMPDRDEDDVPVAKVKQDLVPIPVDPNKQPPMDSKGAPAGGGKGNADVADGTEPSTDMTQQPQKEKKVSFVDAKYRAMARVDFSVIIQRTKALESDTADSVARIAARMVRTTLNAERLPQLLDQDTTDIGALQLDSTLIGKVKGAFRNSLERSWAMGLNQAMDETAKARKQAYSDDVRKVRFADLRSKAAEYFDANAFRMAGNLTDGMRSIIQQELLNAVKAGTRPEEASANIYDRLIRKGFTTLDAMDLEESRDEVRSLTRELLSDALNVANVPAYINTLVRTNTFEALNEARYSEFTDPALADFVQALEYSAVMDDRTTEICQAMDGHVHAADSDVWDHYRPPLHYNCRSILIPITTADGWDGVESADPTVEPQDGFGS